MDIRFVSEISDTRIVIKICSRNTTACDVYINNFVNILNTAKNIKNIIKYNKYIKDSIILDLQYLRKKFVKAFLNRIFQGLYSFGKYKSKTAITKKVSINAPQISEKEKKEILHYIKYSQLARDFINEPSNKSTPIVFSITAANIFKKEANVKVNVLTDKEIKKQGMGLIDAIGNTSVNAARLLVIDYNPPKSQKSKKTVCLIGKGVTIDTGGYTLKSSAGMLNMHMDKTGASLCVGLVKALSQNKYKNRVVAVIPLVENTISDKSVKPGNVVTAYNGQTVEIVNVDAEGRLILADALSYACKNYKPDFIFDYATLTGWSERIHCHTSFTYFTLNNKLSKNIIKYGKEYAERSFRIPAWTDYLYYIKSNIADVKNFDFGCKNSDGFMASIFLMNFIPKEYRKKWVHFDVRLLSTVNEVGIAEGFSTYLKLIEEI